MALLTWVPEGEWAWTKYIKFFSRYITIVVLAVFGGVFIWFLIARFLRGG